MPACKADITISVRAGDKRFTLNCARLPDQHYLIKRGRSRAKKTPHATLSQIFAQARKWAVTNQ